MRRERLTHAVFAVTCLVRANEVTFSPELQTATARPRTNNLAAYILDGSNWTRIRVQIDERDQNGDFVLENGLPFTADGGNHQFDGTDELVIDLPGKLPNPGTFTPKQAQAWLDRRHGVKSGEAWRIRLDVPDGPVDVLLVESMKGEPVPENLVKFDPDGGIVETSQYRYRFNRKNPAALGSLDLRPGGPVTSGGHFGVWLRPPWLMAKLFSAIRRSDEDLDGAIESWRSGPVRTIVAVGGKYSALWSLLKTHLFSELVFYRDRFQIPSVVDIPFSPAKIVGKGSGFAYAVEIAGAVRPTYMQNDGPVPGVAVEHPAGLRLSAGVDPRLAKAGTLPVVWQQGDTREAATGRGIPEDVIQWFEGHRATTGFFVDISGVERGRYDFSLDLESRAEANKAHTDFLTCKSVWTPMAPARTSRPAPKHD